METSSSSEDLSSSECDIESSCEDDSEKFETAKICGATLQLPEELCENRDVFKEFFSLKTWNSLSEINKQHLKNFLPCFPDNDDQEKNSTLQKLFNKEKFRFNSPLVQFHEKLRAGHFRPDIAKMKRLVKQAQRKESKLQQQRHLRLLISRLLSSRQQLLDACSALPPGVEPRHAAAGSAHAGPICPVTYRAKRRYFQELAGIRAAVDDAADWSEDENYPEGPPVQLSKKQRRHLNGLQGSATLSPGAERTVVSTLASKPSGLDLESSVSSGHNPYQLTDDAYRALLVRHRKRKALRESGADLNTKGLTIKEIAARAQLTPIKKSNGKLVAGDVRTSKKKPRPELMLKYNQSPEPARTQPVTSSLPSSNSEPEYSDSDSFIEPVLSPVPTSRVRGARARTPRPKQGSPRSGRGKTTVASASSNEHEATRTDLEPIVVKTETDNGLTLGGDALPSPGAHFGGRIVPTLSDLDGIDMMQLPVDLDHSNIDILDGVHVKQELMQDTHASFLSLVRDIVCSTTEQRMSLASLEERLRAWQENPISPLNDWYSLVDSWVALLPSAVAFLTGEAGDPPDDFVPYLEYKPSSQAYQWIGAGRDSDVLLSPLCQYWLEHRDDSAPATGSAPDAEVDVAEKPATPPPPRCPTQWTVRRAEPEEVEQFREQERRRYSSPHKAFTYRMNGYESVVGPLKGMYNQSAGVSKARGHSMLSADRPNFVTILTLVRDATARLPNGEGTRADICELLKSSQYISQAAPENVLQSVVSGALDRMHTEYDPCVKYDTKKKIWIYLHRNRSETDFERIHQQCQGMSKQHKKPTRKNKPKPKQDKATKQPARTPDQQPVAPAAATAFKTPISRVFTVPAVTPASSTAPLPSSPGRQPPGTSLLVTAAALPSKPAASSKASASDKPDAGAPSKSVLSTIIPAPAPQSDKPLKIVTSTIAPTKQDIEEAIQTLTPIRVTSPIAKQVASPKSTKSLVKIINSSQASKSLVSAATGGSAAQPQTVFIKQMDQKTVIGAKQLLAQPQTTQQLLQSIVAAQQQKQLKSAQQIVQLGQQKQVAAAQQAPKSGEQKPAQGVSSSPQLVQAVAAQPVTAQTHLPQQLLQALSQQKPGTLAAAQQQHLLQTIKQKVAHQSGQPLLSVQQAVLKQHSNLHLQKQLQQQQQQQQIGKATSLLGQQRILTQVATAKGAAVSPTQTPLVAKVLTNAAGQVISVESLLAHQKQHGTLPQGTTLRVSGAKPGQPNLIQLAGSTASQVAQFTVVSQNSVVTVAGQQRLVSAAPGPPAADPVTVAAAAAKPLGKGTSKSGSAKLIPSKLTHQLLNAKFLTQSVPTSKLMAQQKLVMSQQSQVKMGAGGKPMALTKTVASSTQGAGATAGGVRMVNAAGLNLAHIAGKPVLLASKGGALQGPNVILQAQHGGATSGSLVLPGSARMLQTGAAAHSAAAAGGGGAQVVLGAQLKVQSASQVVLGHGLKPAAGAGPPQAVVLGGHTIKMQPAAAASQRLVLASQGQGGQLVAQQILLPAGFQGGAINIKTLQGLKVIPLAQAQQPKGGRPQQVFARIMGPGGAARAPHPLSTQPADPPPNHTSSD